MRTIIKDIAEELLKDGSIAAIVGTRIYGRQPKKEPTEPYIVMNRMDRQRDDIRDVDRFRITIFSGSVSDIEELGELIINRFHEKTVIGKASEESFYYRIELLNETDGLEVRPP